ncbi:MAG TPA: TraM recognition domain-containing protein [Solirubrobacterales bacterium]|nr:TraM recognition domain-containing protein [Solirubrobacterales bacterium]
MMEWAIVLAGAAALGIALHLAIRGMGLRWSWAVPLLALGAVLALASTRAGVLGAGGAAVALTVGVTWHRHELERGGVEAQRERDRLGPLSLVHTRLAIRKARLDRTSDDRFALGQTSSGRVLTIPFGSRQGVRGMILGSPGSGKTVTTAAIAGAYARHGLPIVCVDPKGDPGLRDQLAAAAARSGARFAEWSHEGPAIYNPLSRGDATEIADKALGGETWSEPHYLRQAQRYLGWELRVMQEAGVAIGLRSVVQHMDVELLDALGDLCSPETMEALRRYLASLSVRQRADLGGVRDRLAILGESSLGRWLDPEQPGEQIDLSDAWRMRSVLYFRLDADRYPLASEMLGAAIVSDLVSLTGELQRRAHLGLVAIDEFAALGAREVLRVLSRSRSAGVSVLLATQGLADLGEVAMDTGSEAFSRRVLTQLDFTIAHRQPEPHSASLLASVAGTRPVWVTTRRIDSRLSLQAKDNTGTRTREREFVRHPDEFKTLATGEAIVIEPASSRAAARVRVWAAQPG